MPLRLKTAPAADPVALADVKAHLNIAHSDDDAMLGEYIANAVETLDGRDGYLGRALVTQVWTLTLPAFTREIILPLPPCQSVDAITYADIAGDEQTLDPSLYNVTRLNSAEPSRIWTEDPDGWPATEALNPEAVTVEFTAGYGDPADVPAPIRHAIKEHVSRLYENRETGSHLVDAVSAYRVWRF